MTLREEIEALLATWKKNRTAPDYGQGAPGPLFVCGMAAEADSMIKGLAGVLASHPDVPKVTPPGGPGAWPTDVVLGALATAREEAARVADYWAEQYPVDVFPPESASLDAKAAGHGRHVAKMIAADIRTLGGKDSP